MSMIQVIECLERAFTDVARDPEQSLHQAQLTDQGIHREISPKEWRTAGLLDAALEWHEVDDTDIEACDAALSHMTPISWRFYIPAYMRLTLKTLDKPIWETDVPHQTLFSLALEDSYPGMREYRMERFQTLNQEQHEAVCTFLVYIRDNASENEFHSRDAEIALEKYWGKFTHPFNKSLDTDAAGRLA